MNDIAKPIMRIEKACRRITDQIAHGTMTQTQLSITKHAVMDALTSILEARDWVENAIHSEEQKKTDQRSETRSAREEELKPDWFQEYQQLALDMPTWQTQVDELRSRVEKIEGQLLRLQKPSQPYAAAKQDSQRDVDRVLQDIRERAEAEKKQTIIAQASQLHVASRSLKVD